MRETDDHQPMLRAPKVVLLLIGVLIGVQALISLGGRTVEVALIVELGLFPARFFEPGLEGLPGGLGKGIGNLWTYGLLHCGWAHCLMNSAFLLAFASPVAQRLGWRRFLVMLISCTAIAGLGEVFVASESHYLIPIIGASGGVAGMVGAAARFAFQSGAWTTGPEGRAHQRLLPLSGVFKSGPVLLFIAIWLGANVVFGLLGPLGMGTPNGAPANIAWVAHMLGFVAGLLLIGWFDKTPLSPSGGPGNVDYGGWKGRQ